MKILVSLHWLLSGLTLWAVNEFVPLVNHCWVFCAEQTGVLVAAVVKVTGSLGREIPRLANWGRGASPRVWWRSANRLYIRGPFTVRCLVRKAETVLTPLHSSVASESHVPQSGVNCSSLRARRGCCHLAEVSQPCIALVLPGGFDYNRLIAKHVYNTVW